MSISPDPQRHADGGSDDRVARAEALVHDLQVANAKLRAELDVARADVESLQNALGDVTPLHRHLARDVKRRLGRTDARVRGVLRPRGDFTPAESAVPSGDAAALLRAAVEADRAGVAAWTAQPTSSAPLRAYQRVSRAAYAQLRRLLAALKQKLR